MIYYVGIGSRKTPKDFLDLMTELGEILGEMGCVLRSGGAGGADSYFEKGCDNANSRKEIYLPWRGFNGSTSNLYDDYLVEETCNIAEQYHPAWDCLKDSVKKLMARNVYQVLGRDLKTPSDFIICWTPKGKGSGGTGQAIRLAKAHNIDIIDLGIYSSVEEAVEPLKEFLIQIKEGKYRKED